MKLIPRIAITALSLVLLLGTSRAADAPKPHPPATPIPEAQTTAFKVFVLGDSNCAGYGPFVVAGIASNAADYGAFNLAEPRPMADLPGTLDAVKKFQFPPSYRGDLYAQCFDAATRELFDGRRVRCCDWRGEMGRSGTDGELQREDRADQFGDAGHTIDSALLLRRRDNGT